MPRKLNLRKRGEARVRLIIEVPAWRKRQAADVASEDGATLTKWACDVLFREIDRRHALQAQQKDDAAADPDALLDGLERELASMESRLRDVDDLRRDMAERLERLRQRRRK